jgi:hypothetical protein
MRLALVFCPVVVMGVNLVGEWWTVDSIAAGQRIAHPRIASSHPGSLGDR